MDSSVLPPKLLTTLSAAAEMVRGHDFIHVFSHHDADGISSAGILANMLTRENKEFQITILPILNAETMERIRGCDSKCIIISDLGASYIKELEGLGRDVIVLDHHTVKDDSKVILYANPLLYSKDDNMACGSTMCFLLSVQMNEDNWDLVQIAFAGMTGDRQTVGEVTGFNRYLLDNAIEKGFVRAVDGSMIPPGPLSQSLYYCTEPYFRGISGNIDGVKQVLSDAGIDIAKRSDELTGTERRRLSSLLMTRLAGTPMTVASMREYMHTCYHLNGWDMDSRTLADLLDSCGRMENPGIGIALCLGSHDDLQRAVDFSRSSDEGITQSVIELDRSKPVQMENIQYFYASEQGSTSSVCGIAMKCIGVPGKPMIGIHKKETKTKISARSTCEQLQRGVNLASAMEEAARSLGGEGGGHKIASGAMIDAGKEEEFLKLLDRIIGEQIGAM